MASRLSHVTGIGVIEVNVSSCNNLLNQDNLATSLLIVMYSASVEDRDIMTFFLDFHVMRELPRKTTNPPTNFLL